MDPNTNIFLSRPRTSILQSPPAQKKDPNKERVDVLSEKVNDLVTKIVAIGQEDATPEYAKLLTTLESHWSLLQHEIEVLKEVRDDCAAKVAAAINIAGARTAELKKLKK